jgi:hypothetical protein
MPSWDELGGQAVIGLLGKTQMEAESEASWVPLFAEKTISNCPDSVP